MKLVIKEHASLNGSGALTFVIDGYAALLREGVVSSDVLTLHGSYRVVAAYLGKEVVGAIVFYPYMEDTSFYVALGYVARDRRRQGVYTALWKKLVAIAKREDMITVDGSTVPGNRAMQAAYTKLGRKPYSITYEYRVKGAK